MLYRFRNCQNLIDNNELQDGYIWFSNTSELNDPSEGFINFYWHGDYIAWLGLLKNYVWQLYEYIILSRFADADKLFFTYSNCSSFNASIQNTRNEFEDKVGADEQFVELSHMLDEKAKAVKICGLKNILSMIHFKALCLVCEEMKKRELKNIFLGLEYALNRIFNKQEYTSTFDKLLYWLKNDKQEFLSMTIPNDVMTTFEFNDIEYRNEKDEHKKQYFKSMIKALNFPEIYVSQMIKFAFAGSYTCSFAKQIDSSAMWGNYADNHRGIALIYNYDCKSQNLLEQINNQQETNEINRLHLDCGNVEYADDIPKFNWFYILGKWFGDEREHWLCNGKTESRIYAEMYKNQDKYREDLFSIDKKRMLHKARCWEYENEYRFFQPYWYTEFYGTHISGKRYKYDFKDLDGIVFGIRTSLENKEKIINIVRKKCKIMKRNKFNFYQAYCDYDNGKICTYRLNIEIV